MDYFVLLASIADAIQNDTSQLHLNLPDDVRASFFCFIRGNLLFFFYRRRLPARFIPFELIRIKYSVGRQMNSAIFENQSKALYEIGVNEEAARQILHDNLVRLFS